MFTNKNKNHQHSFYMGLALNQAKRMLGNTKENPAVGCIIANKKSAISAGSTQFNGRPHAEFNAIKFSKFDLKNSNMYLTLEPCTHFGKTPPCTNIIIKNKIKKVIFSSIDPDYRTYNKSSAILKNKNIRVKSGILISKIRNLYRSYFLYKKNQLPFVTGKMAISKDFFTVNKKNKLITNIFSRYRGHYLRSTHDCILTSINTVIMDNPKLTCRIPGLESTSPSRFIIDKELKIPTNSNLVKFSNKYKTFIFFNKGNKRKIKKLKKNKIKLIKLPLNNEEHFDNKHILNHIKKFGYSRILLECGINLTNKFLNDNLINDFYLFISKDNIKKNGSKSFRYTINNFFGNKKFINEKVNLFGDKLISYKIK